METERNAMNALGSLAALDLLHWSGLEGGTSLEQVRRTFDVDDEWRGAGRLGSAGRAADWYSVAADGFPDGLRLWFIGQELVMADARHPQLPIGLDELLDSLGEPQAQLDAYLGTLLIEGSEWVYADRGLTLFVNPANARLLRIAVYRPVDLSEYLEGLRLDLKSVRLPLRENSREGVLR